MTEEQIANYNDHAKFMADIAISILNGNANVLDVNGVKEIIALYLLIPYMTPDKLTTPDGKCIIPNVSGDFCNGISLEDLRNAICHSFVTVEEDKNDGTIHGKRLIVDDRALFHNRKSHVDLGTHSTAANIMIADAHKRLVELFAEIRNTGKEII